LELSQLGLFPRPENFGRIGFLGGVLAGGPVVHDLLK
jgi:hypothetical protein